MCSDDVRTDGPDDIERQRVVLSALMEFAPAPVTFGELARFLAPGLSRAYVEDAVDELRQVGLVTVIAGVTRSGTRGEPSAEAVELVLASRAAVRAHRLYD